MALNIKNPEVERLAAEVAQLAHETKTEAIRKALEERRSRLAVRPSPEERLKAMTEYLEREVWPLNPPEIRGRKMTKQEREEILGIGPHGYPE